MPLLLGLRIRTAKSDPIKSRPDPQHCLALDEYI